MHNIITIFILLIIIIFLIIITNHRLKIHRHRQRFNIYISKLYGINENPSVDTDAMGTAFYTLINNGWK